jgi:GNAT superfamily N-acetyltransferase
MSDGLRAPATEGEWATYHAIRRRVLFELRGNGDAYNPDHPDEHRDGHYPFLLWIAGEPVGVIRVDIDGATAIFRRVAIREDVQRRGYGRRLLSEAEQFARSQTCVRIESHVDPPAVPFYERCGFTLEVSSSGPDRLPLMIKAIV